MTGQAADFALRRALLFPAKLPAENNAVLAEIIAQARQSRLLASLTAALEQEGVLDQLPPEAVRHLQSAMLVHEKQRRDLSYDSESIRRAMDAIGEKLILLKGGAYIAAGLPCGRGRLITDIDIIVPKGRIEDAERALTEQGWQQSKLDPYNESYYRRWSHETPALNHPKRGTTLDLHHNILPPTARPNVDASLLFAAVQEVQPGVFTLCHKDMVIHSATHLFHEGEFYHGLRDLWDIDRMLRQFPTHDPDFWQQLLPRASALELQDSLFHALRYSQMIFETPIPESVQSAMNERPGGAKRPLLDYLFRRAFRPEHPACTLPGTGPALYALYIRSHYLRMPLYLLLPHLVRKAWMQRKDKKEESMDRA